MSKIITDLKKKFNNRTVNVLGTEYSIIFKNIEEDEQLKDASGYCSMNSRELVIAQNLSYFTGKTDEWITNDIKYTIKHEIIHAFFNESGLAQCSFGYSGPWSRNEEMVDWLSIQSSKLFKVFTELDLINVKEVT